ncbi:MAG: type II toxin-antitoxin system YafQ family toxin [Clostridiales bacterium]|nr:type II toxin-antitoxin system YafQ family toxin [Clostridiales bacterium]
MKKRGLDISLLDDVVDKLRQGKQLDEKHHDHELQRVCCSIAVTDTFPRSSMKRNSTSVTVIEIHKTKICRTFTSGKCCGSGRIIS